MGTTGSDVGGAEEGIRGGRTEYGGGNGVPGKVKRVSSVDERRYYKGLGGGLVVVSDIKPLCTS